jgi:hypothetical protein
MTPSRTPLLGQRWTPVASGGGPITFHELPARFPTDVQIGVRYSRTATALDYSVSFFNGSNHLPNVLAVPGPSPTEVGVMKEYPDLRAYGGDAAVPTKWFIAKAEGAYFTSTSPMTDEYVLYVLQVERQVGEWLLIGGYAGQHVTERRLGFSFAPDRGLTESIVARLSYTIDSNRSAAFESAVRQDGGGLYVKGEYSHARGQHWRATAAVTIIRGDETDFLGQYRRNSNAAVSARYSF